MLLGSQAGRTLDTITREVINGGSNVQYGEGQVTGRHLLVGGEAAGNHYFTVRAPQGGSLPENHERPAL